MSILSWWDLSRRIQSKQKQFFKTNLWWTRQCIIPVIQTRKRKKTKKKKKKSVNMGGSIQPWDYRELLLSTERPSGIPPRWTGLGVDAMQRGLALGATTHVTCHLYDQKRERKMTQKWSRYNLVEPMNPFVFSWEMQCFWFAWIGRLPKVLYIPSIALTWQLLCSRTWTPWDFRIN